MLLGRVTGICFSSGASTSVCYHAQNPGASLSHLFSGYQELFPWW